MAQAAITHAAPPIGGTISLKAPNGYHISASPRGGGLWATTVSTLNGHTRYLVESVGGNVVRLQCLGTGLYVRRTGDWDNASLLANGADGNDALCQWEWIEISGSDFKLRAPNTSAQYFTMADDKVKMWHNDDRATITEVEPSDGLEEGLAWRIIPDDPRFPTDDPILAVCEVTDDRFDLPADPATSDCTAAFQAAIEFASFAGGGTVFIPEGHYRVDGPVNIKQGVLLRGRWNPPGETNYSDRVGTVIRLENDQLGPDESVFTGSATMKDLTFWHSKQNPAEGVTPYPWIMNSSQSTFMVNLTFLNAYRGLYFKSISNAEIKNIYGSAYDIGLDLGPNYAIPRLGNYNMSSEYLGFSGLVTDPVQLDAHVNATYATGTGIQAQRLHSTKYVYGHKIGFRRYKTDDMTKGSQLDLNGAIVRNCQIGALNDLDNSGPSHISGTLMENCEVATSFKTGGSFSLNNSAIIGSQNWDVLAQAGAINVTINNSMLDATKLSLNGGSVTGTPLASPPALIEDAIVGSEEDIGDEEESLDLSGINYRNPTNPVLFNVKDPQYAGGAKGNGVEDDSAAIQATLDAAASQGGYVFFPAGNYRITTSLVVGDDIQLRGADSGLSSADSPLAGSSISIDIPPVATNEMELPASFTLGDRSGVRALAFFYPNQTAGGPVPFVKFPFTIRGNGVENYVMLSRPINPYRFVHFTGDDSTVAYNQLCGIRQILYSTGNKNGLFDQNLTKVTRWYTSGFPFPGTFSKDAYKGYVMNAGFEILHIKDCDDFVSTFGGSYAHGGFRGATVENSSVTGNLSLEQYLYGWNIVSGNKNCSFRNKTSTTNRDGPAGADTETFGIKLGEDFTGTVVEETGDIHGGSFSDYALVENGTLKRIGGKVRGSMMGIRVGEKGTAIMENSEFKDELNIQNEGALKLFNCTVKNGIYHPFAQPFRADNTIEGGTFIAARLARRTWQSFGMTIDTNGLEYVGSALAGGGFSESDVKAKTTTGQFNFTVQEPDFINDPPQSMTFSMVEGYVPSNTVTELWYYSTSGWVKHSGSGPSFSLSNTAFGQQQAGEDVPDLRLVVTGDSPSAKGFKISTGFYQPAAPKSPTGLVAAAGDTVLLDWDDNTDATVTYNVYRRHRSSGAFGDPIATALTESTFPDLTASDGLTNYYVVTAVDADGLESAISFQTDTDWEPVPTILTRSLSDAILYRDYTANLQAAGEAPFAWSVVGGALPAGLTLATDGTLSGQATEAGLFDVEVAVSDGVGGEASTNAFSLNVVYKLPLFIEDFEDDTVDSTNNGLGLRSDQDGPGEDADDVGKKYLRSGDYVIKTNPDKNGNASSQSILMHNMAGVDDNNHVTGIFESPYPVDGLQVSFEFYHEVVNPDKLKPEDAMRFYLVGADEASTESYILFPRDAGYNPSDGQVLRYAPAHEKWHRFTGRYTASGTPGVYDLEWTVLNLEDGTRAGGVVSVDLADGSWAGNGLDTTVAGGVRLFVRDRDNAAGYLAYFDNVNVSYRPTSTVTDPVGVITAALPEVRQHNFYSVNLEASGVYPFTWSVTDGTLPSGLALQADGTLIGIPDVAALSEFTVQVVDDEGRSDTQVLTLNVQPFASVDSLTVRDATTGNAIGGYTTVTNDIVIDKTEVGTGALNIRANTTPETDFGHVRFELSGATSLTVTNDAPDWDLLAADLPGGEWADGAYTLTVTPHDINGTAGNAFSINITVVEPFTLTVNSGSGDGTYTEGTVVNISADAAPNGYVFDQWIGDVAGVTDVNRADTTLTMSGTEATISASYVELPRIPIFSDDFEDDTPTNTTNQGLDIRDDVDGAGEDEADVGAGYSDLYGEYQIRANPDPVGNSSSQVLFMNQIGSGTQDPQYINGLFGDSYPVDDLEVQFDFYNTYLSTDNLYDGDAVRFYLIGSDNASVESEIRLHRNGTFSIDGNTISSAVPVTNAWQRFTGTFKATGTPGIYDLEWTLENLETSAVASGTNTVNLNNGAWATNTIDSTVANGIRLYVHDKKNNESYLGYFDNVNVSTIGDMLEPYDVWAGLFGGEDVIGSATNDYDGDSVANLAEYAFGGNPTNGLDAGEAPTLHQTGGILVYIHPQRSDDTGLVYIVETSTNLVSGGWINAGYAVLGTNVTESTLNYVTNTVPTDEDQTYIRLKVLQ